MYVCEVRKSVALSGQQEGRKGEQLEQANALAESALVSVSPLVN